MIEQPMDIESLERQLGQDANAGMAGQAYANVGGQNDNLIVWQLELDNILERVEHLLKGEAIKVKNGEVEYVSPEDKSLIVLNEYGVQLIMNKLSFYLNRNTILSNYSADRISEILYDIGMKLADLVYINYEKMGLDTVEKRARYEPLIMTILHTIESAYNRALAGAERDSLRSARVVTQTQPLSVGGMQTPQRKGFSLNPFKAFRRY